MVSDLDGDPARFDDREWIAAPYTTDGRTVYALVHDEYQGDKHPGRCPSGEYLKCWYNAITLARSTDGGRTFTHARRRRATSSRASRTGTSPTPAPTACSSRATSSAGREDGYYYALIRAAGVPARSGSGTCVMRTATLGPTRLLARVGRQRVRRQVRRPVPERERDAGDHVCAPVSFPQIGTMTESLTYNTYLGKYAAGGAAPGRSRRASAARVTGIYYSISDDLDRTGRRAQADPRGRCSSSQLPVRRPEPGRLPVRARSATARRATSRRPAGRPYLYFTRFHYATARRPEPRPRARADPLLEVSAAQRAAAHRRERHDRRRPAPRRRDLGGAPVPARLRAARARGRRSSSRSTPARAPDGSTARLRERRLHARRGGALRARRTAGRCSRPARSETAGLSYERVASGRPRRRRADQHLGHPDRRGPDGRRAACGSTSTSTPPSTSSGTRRASTCASAATPLRDGRPGDRHARRARCRPAGIDWIPTVPPVVLEHWPRARDAGAAQARSRRSATGAATARSSTRACHYGQKAHSMRELMAIPTRTDAVLRLALDVHPGETPDLEALDRNGWQLVDPATVAARPGLLPRVHRRLAGRARHREERLRALALRLVQRSQRLLPRLRQAGAGAGHRLRRLPARRARGCSRSPTRTTRSPAIEEIRADYDAPRRAPRARSPRSTSTPTRCCRACSSAWAARDQREPSTRQTAELRAALERALGDRTGSAASPITGLERRPCAYRTSFALEELDVALADGSALRLMFKDLSRACLDEDALARQAGASSTTRCARSRSTATCSTAPGSARAEYHGVERRPGARPLLAVHRERRRRRAVADRRVRRLGGDGAAGSRACTARSRRLPRRRRARCCATTASCFGVWIAPGARVRRATRATPLERRRRAQR